MKENIILKKSYGFAVKILTYYKALSPQNKIIFDQLRKSATSIGANVEEANGSPTRKDFNNKMFIAYKEARESTYWITLLKDSGYIDKSTGLELLEELEEIKKILGKILKTSKLKAH